MRRHQRLLDPATEPSGEYMYKDPDTGYTSKERSFSAIIITARLHRIQNGLPVDPDFALMVETQICERSPGQCVSRDGAAADMSCIHAGEFVRWQGCDTCGSVRAKIFACAIHGEATWFKRDLSVRHCWCCPDRQAIPA